MNAVTSLGSKTSFVVGALLAILTTAVATLFWSLAFVIVPVIGVLSLTLSWLWPHKMLRGFSITLIVLTLAAYAWLLLAGSLQRQDSAQGFGESGAKLALATDARRYAGRRC